MFGAESLSERLSSPQARKRSPGCRAEFPGQGTHDKVSGPPKSFSIGARVVKKQCLLHRPRASLSRNADGTRSLENASLFAEQPLKMRRQAHLRTAFDG
jgi:hypothetical protein